MVSRVAESVQRERKKEYKRETQRLGGEKRAKWKERRGRETIQDVENTRATRVKTVKSTKEALVIYSSGD